MPYSTGIGAHTERETHSSSSSVEKRLTRKPLSAFPGFWTSNPPINLANMFSSSFARGLGATLTCWYTQACQRQCLGAEPIDPATYKCAAVCICGPGPLDLLLKSEKVSKIERVIVVVVKWFHLSVLSRVLRRSRHVGFHWAAYTVPGLKKRYKTENQNLNATKCQRSSVY